MHIYQECPNYSQRPYFWQVGKERKRQSACGHALPASITTQEHSLCRSEKSPMRKHAIHSLRVPQRHERERSQAVNSPDYRAARHIASVHLFTLRCHVSRYLRLSVEDWGGPRDMALFSWKQSPEDFVEALATWAARVKRRGHNAPGGRRHIIATKRRRVAWYKRLNGIAQLPRVHHAMEGSMAWEFDAPTQLKIVIPQEAGGTIGHISPSGANMRTARKAMRKVMHEAARRDDQERVVLVSARRDSLQLPAIGRNLRGHGEIRALYLDSLGIMITPDLTVGQVDAFEAAGALVLTNEEIAIEDRSERTGRSIPKAEHLDAIEIHHAREAKLAGKGVTIGVLDSGIDARHPEFAGKAISFRTFKASGEPGGKRAKDYGTHGTHVAALAAGKNVGVAPEADLAVAAVLAPDRNGRLVGYTAQILAGVNWLADPAHHGRPVDLINASLGGAANEQLYHSSILVHRLTGLLMIAAIGNSGEKGMGNHSVPGKLDCTIGVGAVDNQGLVANFSDWGPCFDPTGTSTLFKPDIMAPGVMVESAVPKRAYARKDGTSMASPIVAGAAALLIEKNGSLRQNPDGLSEAIFTLINDLPPQGEGYDPRRGGRGRLSLRALAE